MLTSLRNQRLKAFATLKTNRGRHEYGLALAEGLHLVEEACRSSLRVRTLLIAAAAHMRPETARLKEMARKRGAEIIVMSDACYRRISDLQSPEGVAVAIEITNPEIAPLIASPQARLLVAVGVQDPGNAGALARVAEAAGASACLFIGGVDPWSPKFLRAAMGSSFRLPCTATTVDDFLNLVQNHRLRLLAAASPRSASLLHLPLAPFDRADYRPPIGICMGGEGSGLPLAILETASAIFIPMAGAVESLNVAVAAGIILYAARTQWGNPNNYSR